MNQLSKMEKNETLGGTIHCKEILPSNDFSLNRLGPQRKKDALLFPATLNYLKVAFR